MAYDYTKLNGRIIEKCGTRREFAKRMGLSECSISHKLRSFEGWKQSQIELAVKILELDKSEIPIYFFTLKLT